jgi:hypothetical protein
LHNSFRVNSSLESWPNFSASPCAETAH